MKGKLLITFALTLLACGAASATQQEIINWCAGETNAPAQGQAMAQTMPDGKLRGTRSAAVLIAEARNAKTAGNCSAAVQWILACVDHDSNAQNQIRADETSACNLL